ncbi:hypothetical protein SARC_00440 [Sphaeroforma arctica JP610]|uniref:Uncharacterized protein n=1 Tax=Sphaeroforma arctica JP610 TaxID=667725 RepID=A0A0L0GGK4_9EUKA|nr:hypothetical protein SARC_00440 [Sphaeroforma arctica JP610]KNC87458.1 hypothetical protein SARC_00440 [Sphaeroforma arctica JP610]|eukprot:XP_014161360.1 hypothetical protein SARC_00440 [Sphaeroforma arctica JP610]
MENFLYGAASAVSAICIVHPIDVVKTRLQLQGEMASHSAKQYTGITSSLINVAKHEGMAGLYKGLGAACMLQITVTGTRFGFYNYTKELLGVNKDSPNQHMQNMGLALGAGICGAVAGNPFYAMKTRFQASAGGSSVAVGHQHQVTTLTQEIKRIIVQEGPRGYFRGVTAFIPRVVAFSTGQLTSYDFCKHHLLQRGWADDVTTHLTSGSAAAAVGITLMQPFDFLAARIMNQPLVNGKPAYYKGVVDCAVKSVKSEGIFVLFKGASANYARMCPYNLLCFVFFEQYKKLGTKLFHGQSVLL